MRALLQRSTGAAVVVENRTVGSIQHGLVVLLGVTHEDTEADATYLADKILGLRIFRDSNGKMNLSIQEVGGSVLLISQFTLYGDTRKGRRPGFDRASSPEHAKKLYETMQTLLERGVSVETGIFGASMQVSLINDGPVTFLLDSKDR